MNSISIFIALPPSRQQQWWHDFTSLPCSVRPTANKLDAVTGDFGERKSYAVPLHETFGHVEHEEYGGGYSNEIRYISQKSKNKYSCCNALFDLHTSLLLTFSTHRKLLVSTYATHPNAKKGPAVERDCWTVYPTILQHYNRDRLQYNAVYWYD